MPFVRIIAFIARLREMRRSFPASFFYTLLILLIFPSCRKDNSNIGIDLIDDQLGVVFNDTLYLQTHTIREDSLPTSNRSVTSLGTYDDPVFGKTTASVYSQFLLSTSNPPFAGSTCDSVVLTVAFNNKTFYGTLDPQRFMVYQLTESFYKDSTYYSNDTLLMNSVPIGDVVVTPNPFDSVVILGDSLTPQMRIRLSQSFGDYVLNASSSDLSSNTSFANYFKGIYITALPHTTTGRKAGGIMYLSWSDPSTRITIYYHNQFGSHHDMDQQQYPLVIDQNTASFNHFEHDYSGRPAIDQQLLESDTVGKDLVYVQGLSGLKTKFRVYDLMDLEDSGDIAINKAELVLREDISTHDNDYQTPPKLALVALDSAGKQQLLTDYLEGETYFGGIYDAVKKEYRFNIARHLQELLNGEKTDYGLVLVVSGGAVSANRVVLGGGKPTSPYKMRLRLAYTKLN